MQDDETIIMPLINREMSETVPLLSGVKITLVSAYVLTNNEFYFSRDISIGRSIDNDIVIPDSAISRRQIEIKREYDGCWYVIDLNSTNGSYLGEVRLQKIEKLSFPCTIRFGKTETCLQLHNMDSGKLEMSYADASDVTEIGLITSDGNNKLSGNQTDLTREDMRRKFLQDINAEDAGDYTKMMRSIITEDRRKKTRKYKVGLGIAVVAVIFTIGLLVHQQQKINSAKDLAVNIFYDMKTLEVDLSSTEIQLKEDSDQVLWDSVAKKREKLHEMQNKYKAYVDELNSSKFHVIPKQAAFLRKIPIIGRMTADPSYEAELILKVARELGECELELPDGFIDEVKKYIDYWRSSSRMTTAMMRLEENNYAPIILDALHKENIPVQFLYLSMQESNFDTNIVGPPTKYGHAKGAWQFIPETGAIYGLKPGPLVDTGESDPQDERQDFTKATYAAAKYLKKIYAREAAGSALLVMAGYNWGEGNIIKKMRAMPEDPRSRNFWKFSQQFQMPKETYNYVYYIVSAAVIGENPAYFGFKFQSPTLVAERVP